MEEETEGSIQKNNFNLYLPNRITKPENWQFIKLIAPNAENKRWTTTECKGAYCEKCKMAIVYKPKTGNTKQVQLHMSKYHPKAIIEFKNRSNENKRPALIGIEKFVTKKQRIDDMLPASKNNQAISDALLTLWVAKSLRPFSIVEDAGLIEFINYAIALQGRLVAV